MILVNDVVEAAKHLPDPDEWIKTAGFKAQYEYQSLITNQGYSFMLEEFVDRGDIKFVWAIK